MTTTDTRPTAPATSASHGALIAFGVFVTALAAALYGRHTDDTALTSYGLLAAVLAFLAALGASLTHQRRVRP